jgi:HEAT repeat protein
VTDSVLARKARAKSEAERQREIKRRADSLVRSIKSGKIEASPAIIKALKEVAVPSPSQTECDVLAPLLLTGDRDERIQAASCLAHVARIVEPQPESVFRLSREWWQTYSKDDTATTIKDGLTKAVSDKILEIQRDLLKAFPVLRFGGAELLPVFVKLLSAEQEEVRRAAVLAIGVMGIDLAATVVGDIEVLLSDPVTTVRSAVCELLTFLGHDAVRAVPALVDRIEVDDFADVRRLAVRAIVAIDSDGAALSKIKNQAKRGTIIEALTHLGADGRQLRHRLPVLWAEEDARDPGLWMSIPEIAEKIVCDVRTLRRRIRDNTVRPHDKRGEGRATKYLVTNEDLDHWKQV